VSYFNVLPTPSTIRSQASVGLALLGATALIAGCGSSSSSESGIGVGKENSANNALIKAGEKAGEKASSTPTTTTATTPTSGPLSKEPKVTPPSGPAPSKLVVKDLITGTGPEAKTGETVTVNYVGVLYKGGKEFDASWKRNEPFSFPLGEGKVIAGWDQGVAGMKVGGRRELIIPAALGYGAQGSGSAIPPNAPLIFVVDLLGT